MKQTKQPYSRPLTKLLLSWATLQLTYTSAFESIVRPDFPVIDEKLAPYPDLDWNAHEVHTDDGYILNLIRLTTQDQSQEKQPVLLVHGMMSNGVKFLRNITPDIYPFAISLALDGHFDVWIANSRATFYS